MIEFSTRSGRYRDTDTGRFVSQANVRKLVDDEQNRLNNKIQRALDGFFDDRKSSEDVQIDVGALIKQANIRTMTLGAGGDLNLRSSPQFFRYFGAQGAQLRQQYGTIASLLQASADGELTEAQIRDRFRRQSLRVQEAYTRAEQLRNISQQGFNEARRSLAPGVMHCFVAGTMVATDQGDRPIESLQVGDRVYTRSGLRPILETYSNPYYGRLIKVSCAEKSVVCTSTHPFLTQVGWAPAWELLDVEGFLVSLFIQGSGFCYLQDASVERFVDVRTDDSVEVYNIKVDVDEEYFANGILVHNCPDCPNYETNGWIPIDEVVPRGVSCRCGGYCYCQVQYRFNPQAAVFSLQNGTDSLTDIIDRSQERTLAT